MSSQDEDEWNELKLEQERADQVGFMQNFHEDNASELLQDLGELRILFEESPDDEKIEICIKQLELIQGFVEGIFEGPDMPELEAEEIRDYADLKPIHHLKLAIQDYLSGRSNPMLNSETNETRDGRPPLSHLVGIRRVYAALGARTLMAGGMRRNDAYDRAADVIATRYSLAYDGGKLQSWVDSQLPKHKTLNSMFNKRLKNVPEKKSLSEDEAADFAEKRYFKKI